MPGTGVEVEVVTATGLSVQNHQPEGHPQTQTLEPLDVQEPSHETDNIDNDETTYPSGIKLWMAVISVCMVSLIVGLDLTIVAATVPSLTNYFKTVRDIGWYSSAYSL